MNSSQATHTPVNRQKTVRFLSLLLCLLMLVGSVAELVACGTGDTAETTSTGGETNSEPEVTAEEDPFKNVDYKGREFRILTSTNIASAGMGNSNYLIEGEKDAASSMVNDAVFERNAVVEKKIGVQLKFTQLDVDYNGVFSKIRTYVANNLDEYDLVINDLFPFANLSIEGNFRNILAPEFTGFDFEDKTYWYKEYMDDLRLQNGYEYILAGDFFIDVLRSSHLLLFNKGMYQDHYQRDPNEVYDWVLNYEWTYEKMNQMITDMYDDKNQNGSKDYGDQWGISVLELWGSSIGFVVSANPGFITRDEDGTPYPALGENSRGEDLTDWLNKIVYNKSACFGITSDAKILQDFTEGLSLICDYQRLGSLENTILLSMQGEAGVLPCPMLYASDKQYNTATHDTTEVGAIMTTAKDAEFISTVIQVLNRETASLLIPKYYGEALQVQYVTDPYASKMVQIIHDNIRESFILAYNNWTGSIMLNVFSNAVSGKRSFSAMYNARSSRNMQTNMNRMIKTFKRYNKIL